MGTYIGKFEVETLKETILGVAQASLAIMTKSTNQFQLTRLTGITSLPDKHYSLDSEDGFHSGCQNIIVTNSSSFQNCPHPDDHTIQTTDTPGFKPLQRWSLF